MLGFVVDWLFAQIQGRKLYNQPKVRIEIMPFGAHTAKPHNFPMYSIKIRSYLDHQTYLLT